MKSFQSRAQRKYKSRYGITNWAEYEAGLRQRGSVTIWITADAKDAKDAKDARCHRGLQTEPRNKAMARPGG